MEQKFLDKEGLKVLWNQVSLKDYPNNETLMAVIDAIDETKADKDELFSKSWNDLTDKPFYANDSTFDANINPLNNYEKVKGDLYRNISSNSAIKYIKDCTGIDINVPTNGYVAGKNLKVIITNESGEEKVVSVDNPYYIVGVTDNGYPYIRFCGGSVGYMPVHEYRVEENDLVYHYVYTHFAVGAWYDYGINSNEWGYNPGTEAWLGTNYSFHFTVENVVKLDEKYIPETISRVGHTHSFDSLEDKPFRKAFFDELNCIYDPNHANNVVNTNGEKIWYLGGHIGGTDDIHYITDSNGRIYKVPFNKTSSYCYKATFNLTGGNEVTIYNVYLTSGGTIDGITFPAGGTYATAPLFDDGLFIAKIEYAIYLTLHENYIPDSIARTADVDEKIENHTYSWNNLEDKPFGEYAEELEIADKEIPFTSNSYTYRRGSLLSEPVNKISVYWNGIKYECESIFIDDIRYGYGNCRLYGDYYDSGEPFALIFDTTNGNTTVIKNNNETETVSCKIAGYEEGIKLIDDKYISYKLVRGCDVLEAANQNSSNIDYSPRNPHNLATKKYVDYIVPTEMDAIALLVETGFIDSPATNNGIIFTDNNGTILTL